MKLTIEQYQCISESICFENDEDEFDYKYKEIKERSYKHSSFTTFVFFYKEKWFMGEIECVYEDGIQGDEIECWEVEPYEVIVTKYRKKGETC